MKNLKCFQDNKHIRKPTHNELTHIAFWETPSYQVINFWIVNFSETDPSEIFTSSDAYEKPALSNYVYLNRERIVRDLYEYLEGNK